MTALWAAAAIAALLFAALLCPVRYRCRADGGGLFAEVRLFGGLWRKTIRRPWGAEDAPEEEPAAPVRKEAPLRLSPDGRRENEPAREERPAGAEPAPEEEKKEEQISTEETKAGGAKKKPGALAVLTFAWDNGTVHIALRAAGRILRHSRPGYLRLTGRAGLGDPMKTGMAAGLLYAALPGCVFMDWDFTGRTLAAAAEAGGRVIPLYVLVVAGGALASGPVRRTITFARGRAGYSEEASYGRRSEKKTV